MWLGSLGQDLSQYSAVFIEHALTTLEMLAESENSLSAFYALYFVVLGCKLIFYHFWSEKCLVGNLCFPAVTEEDLKNDIEPQIKAVGHRIIFRR